MAKRRMIQRGLIRNSLAAYHAAIEIHNKPSVEYRYETVSLLLLNAWELALKAYVRKCTKRSVFQKDGHSISFSVALKATADSINQQHKGSFASIESNLKLLHDYRNQSAHFYSDETDPIVFSLIAKAAMNYTEFMAKYFDVDAFGGQNLTILPLGFKLPFEPEGFLSKQVVQPSGSPQFNAFVNKIVTVTQALEAEGCTDSVVLGFTMYIDSTKKISNADILATIDKSKNAIPFTKNSRVRLTTDPSAQPMRLSDEVFFATWPLKYAELAKRCREEIADFKQDSRFNKAKLIIQGNLSFANQRSLDEARKNTRWYYSEAAVEEIARLWPDL